MKKASLTYSKPSPIERARIRALTGCDEATIRAFFSETPDRELKSASVFRIVNACGELGIALPGTRKAA